MGRNYNVWQRMGSLLLTAVLVLGMVPVTGVSAATTGTVSTDGILTQGVNTVADPQTLERPQLIYGENTLNTGMITVDKSVSKSPITLTGELPADQATIGLTDPNNFLVTVSQTAQVTGLSSETAVPVDVVFVLDTSGSMNESNRETTMVNAVNNAIRTLMAANANNRVGVVAFSDINDDGSSTEPAAVVLSNLASYTGTAATNHLTWDGSDIVGRGNGSGSRDGSNGGTNIQAGVVMGAKMLASATNLTVDGVTRMPFLIILSDGAPTYNFSSTTWYDPDMTGSQYGPGNDNGTLYTGNGFLPALVAAYYKGVITEHYFGTNASEDNRCSIYTLGVSIDNSSLAQLTMNPKENFDADANGNTHAGRFATYWRNYQAGNAFNISCENNTNLNITKASIDHTKNYVNGKSSSGATMYSGGIAYNDGYYSATQTSQINSIFQEVVTEITKKAVSVPTKVEGTLGDNFSGYVTFHDPIGEYMEVKDLKGIVADGKFYRGATAAQYLAAYGTPDQNAEFNEKLLEVLGTRLTMTESSGVSVADLLATADGNTITWWGRGYKKTGEEEPGMQVIGAAEDDSVEYIEKCLEEGTVPVREGDNIKDYFVCRSYFFYGTAGDPSVGSANAEYMYFIVRVQRSLTAPYQQTVVISAPASLLSMEKVIITESEDDQGNAVYSASVESAAPARVIYEVGLRSDITAENVSTIVTNAYKNETVTGNGSVNYDAATDTYQFFTNDWDRTKDGSEHHRAKAYAAFDAALDNPFYAYQQDTLVVDASGNAVTSNPAGTVAYYERTYYDWSAATLENGTYTGVQKKTQLIKVEIPENFQLIYQDGKYYIPKHTYTASTLETIGDDTLKESNDTNTALIVSHAHRTGEANNSHYTVLLGNNGMLSLKANTPKPTKDVSITKPDNTVITDANGKPVMVGDKLTYTVAFKNVTAETATITITDAIPAGTALVPNSITNGGVYADGKITWTFTDVSPNGDVTASFQVEVTEAALETAVGYIQNQAKATIGGNEYSTNIVTNPPQGKKVTTTNTTGSVKVGDRLTYSIEFHNDAVDSNGQFVESDVIITDIVPAGTKFISADHGGQVSVDANNREVITWTIQGVEPDMGGVVTFVVEVTVDARTTVENNAKIQIGPNGPVQETNNTVVPVATGSLELKKLLAAGDSANRSFELVLKEQTGKLNGTFSNVEFTNGEAKVQIAANDTITISGLPAGIDIVVVETAADGWTPAYSSNSVTITANSTANVTVTNDYYAEPVKFQLRGVKTFSGTNFPFGTFTFLAQQCDANGTLTPNGIVVDAVATYETDGSAAIIFSERTFASKIDRYYLITEGATTVPGVTIDPNQYLLHLQTNDNGNGKWELTYTLSKKDGNGWTQVSTNADATDKTGVVTASGADFTNTYKAAPVDVVISGTKSLTGRYLKANDFSFQLIEGQNVVATTTNGAGTTANPSVGSFSFPAITYTETGVHTYYIREVTSNPTANTTYDYDYYKVVVTVVDDGSGQLKASYSVEYFEATGTPPSVTYPDTGTILVTDASDWTLIKDYIGYSNKFTPSDASVTLTGTKTLSGAGVDGETTYPFSFSVYKSDADGVKGSLVTVGSANVTGASTSDITFAKIGITPADMADSQLVGGVFTKTFYFLVEEDRLASDPNMYYDPAQFLATVEVTYNPNDGKLIPGAVIYQIKSGDAWATAQNGIAYHNTRDYITVTPVGTKLTTGTALPAGLRFSFRVTDANGKLAGTGMSLGTVEGTASENAIEFTSLVITEEMFAAAEKDSNGYATFVYYIQESNTDSDNGITYDKNKFVYEVKVKRNSENELQVVDNSEKYYLVNQDGSWTERAVRFENTYAAEGYINLTAHKTTSGTYTLKGDDFDFRLQRLNIDGTLVEGSAINGTNDDLGNVSFATLNFVNSMLTDEYKHNDGTSDYYLFDYLMTEIKPDTGAIPGIKYDEHMYIVSIKLTVNGSDINAEIFSVKEAREGTPGVYTAKPGAADQKGSAGDTGVTFINIYSVQQGTAVTIQATKTLSGRALAEGEFGFNLSRFDATTGTWKNVGTAFNALDGSISFTRHYNASTLSHMASDFVDQGNGIKEFTVLYCVEEVDSNLGGITYSDSKYYVQVVVVHNLNDASYTIKDGYPKYYTDEECTEEATEVVFANSYDTNDVRFTPVASKVLLGANNTVRNPAGFSFQVVETDASGNKIEIDATNHIYKVVSTGTSDAEGDVTFSAIHYTTETHCDSTTCAISGCACNGTGKVHSHYYTIVEQQGSAEGVTYSKEAYYVKVDIHDNGRGLLEITGITYYSDAFITPIQDSADAGEQVDGGEIVFTNHYGSGYIDLELDIDKVFQTESGRNYVYKLNGAEFNFQVFSDEACTQLVTVGTNGASDSNGVASIIFGTIEIEKNQLVNNRGIFTYYIKEVSRPGITHITTDSTVIKVEVTVTDDGYGNLSADYRYFEKDAEGNYTVELTEETRNFSNTYKPKDTQITLELIKHLHGKDLTAEVFTFLLEDQGGEVAVAWTHNGGKYFGEITYGPEDMLGATYANGVYTKVFNYTLKEQPAVENGSTNGIYQYDPVVYKVTVTLTDNGSGALVASVIIKDANDQTLVVPVFNNTYTPNPIEVDLSTGIDANKKVEAPDGSTVNYLLAGHKFQVLDLSGNPVKDAEGADIIGISEANGTIRFPAFVFNNAGEFRYLIKEIIPEGAVLNADGTYTYQGVTYDATTWCTHILVRYDAQAGLLYVNDGSEDNEPDDVYTHVFSGAESHGSGAQLQMETTPAFVNRYNPAGVAVDIQADKFLEGRELKDHEFTFRLLNADGTIAAEAKNHADGSITFLLDYELADLGGAATKDFTYTMVEVIPDTKLGGVSYSTQRSTVTVTVTDSRTGNLVVTIGGVDYSNGTYASGNVFTNTYAAKETTAVVEALKRLDGTKPLGENDYEFRLVDNADPSKIFTAKNDASGKIRFALPAYTAAGVYTYTLTEVLPGVVGGGMTYDETEYTVTVTVTDDLVGQLHAEVAYSDADGNIYAIPVFTNSYLADGAPVDLKAHKDLFGMVLKAGDFTFKLLDAEGNEVDSTTNAANGDIQFRQLIFSATGVYTYTISEVKGDNPGMTYDETVYTVTVTVTDENFDGKLDAEVVYTKNGQAVTGVPKFENTYRADDHEVQISAEKELTGKDMEAEEFTFTLVGNGKNLTAKNDAEGKISFPKITITADDMVDENGNPVLTKSFVYTLSEVRGENPGMVYDTAKYTVTVIVTDDGKGNLSHVVEYTCNDITIETEVPVFHNTYDAGTVNELFEAEKILNGKDLVAGQFTFVLKAEDGTVLDTLTHDADGKILFQPVIYSEAKVYKYTLAEVKGDAKGMTYDETVYTVTVTVTDDGNGQLTAVKQYSINGTAVEKMVFTNTYKGQATTADVEAKKVLTGKDMVADEFSFTLVNKDNSNESYTAKNAQDGTVTFENLTFTEAGVYTYLLSEVKGNDGNTSYDETVYTVVITVTDDGKGQLNAAVQYLLDGKAVDQVKFTNVYTPDPVVVPLVGSKDLTGRDQVAGEFTFEVRDAQNNLIATGTNTADGKIVFDEIKAYGEGEVVLYVTEVAGDAPRVEYDDYTYRVKITVTNNNGVLEPKVTYLDGEIVFYNVYLPEVPTTGDNTPVALYTGLLMSSLMALAAVLVLLRKKETV